VGRPGVTDPPALLLPLRFRALLLPLRLRVLCRLVAAVTAWGFAASSATKDASAKMDSDPPPPPLPNLLPLPELGTAGFTF
jgi:hypothetical protein